MSHDSYNWEIQLRAPKKRNRKKRPALFLSTGELAALWGMSDRTIRNYIYAGTLPAVRTGERGHWRIDPTELQAGRTSIKEVTKIRRETQRRAEELLTGAAPTETKKDTPTGPQEVAQMEVSENPFVSVERPTRKISYP